MSKSSSLFMEGAITPEFISKSIAKHSTKTGIGAHQIFLGQIRADEKEEGVVASIEFTAYREMAEKKYAEIREEIFSTYSLSCMHVYHSLGDIGVGEINLFVFVSSKHRKDATEACSDMVEKIKNELPIWGKEILENDNYTWKVNR